MNIKKVKEAREASDELLLDQLITNSAHRYRVVEELRRRMINQQCSSLSEYARRWANQSIVPAEITKVAPDYDPVFIDKLRPDVVQRRADLEVTFDIHALAKEMRRMGYSAEGLKNPKNARKFITLAAANPNVENELPDSGFRFWKACKYHYDLWKAGAEEYSYES